MKRTVATFSFLFLAQFAGADAAAQGGADRGGQAPADTTIQAGVYELSVAFGGGVLEATLNISFSRDTVTAVLKMGDHDSPLMTGTRRGSKLTLQPKAAGVDLRYDLEFSGQNVKGTFTYQGQAGTVTGERRPSR